MAIFWEVFIVTFKCEMLTVWFYVCVFLFLFKTVYCIDSVKGTKRTLSDFWEMRHASLHQLSSKVLLKRINNIFALGKIKKKNSFAAHSDPTL